MLTHQKYSISLSPLLPCAIIKTEFSCFYDDNVGYDLGEGACRHRSIVLIYMPQYYLPLDLALSSWRRLWRTSSHPIAELKRSYRPMNRARLLLAMPGCSIHLGSIFLLCSLWLLMSLSSSSSPG